MPNLLLPFLPFIYFFTKYQKFQKGFEQDTKLDDILNFVKQFGDVENVLMRREKSDKRAFKGSVFVTYKDQKVAEAFVKNDTQQFNGKDLLKMMQ